MSIYQRPAFLRALRKYFDSDQERIRQRARRVAEVIGQPHAHSGFSVRPFGRYFEFRLGLSVRCLFLLEGGDLHLVIVGTHDEVAAYVRNNG